MKISRLIILITGCLGVNAFVGQALGGTLRPIVEHFLRRNLRGLEGPIKGDFGFHGMSVRRFGQLVESGVVPPGPQTLGAIDIYIGGRRYAKTAFKKAASQATEVARRDRFFEILGKPDYTRYPPGEVELADSILRDLNIIHTANWSSSQRRYTHLRFHTSVLDLAKLNGWWEYDAIKSAALASWRENGVVIGLKENLLRGTGRLDDGLFRYFINTPETITPAGKIGPRQLPYTFVNSVSVQSPADLQKVRMILGIGGMGFD